MWKILFLCSFFCFFLFACDTDTDTGTGRDLEIERQYCSEEELAQRKSGTLALENYAEWAFQYPSGSEEGGMINANVTPELKNKYFSLFESPDGKKYMRFSLDASDKGKSPYASSVRSELRHKNEWTLADKTSLEYTFYLTSTDFSTAKFTVGQFLQICDTKESPLCRIEVENGQITAKVINYKKDGTTKSDGETHKYSLGTIVQKQEVTIKIAIDNKVMRLYRDGKELASHIFPAEVESGYKNYYKAGIYYQNKDSPKIFSEVFIRNLSVNTDILG